MDIDELTMQKVASILRRVTSSATPAKLNGFRVISDDGLPNLRRTRDDGIEFRLHRILKHPADSRYTWVSYGCVLLDGQELAATLGKEQLADLIYAKISAACVEPTE